MDSQESSPLLKNICTDTPSETTLLVNDSVEHFGRSSVEQSYSRQENYASSSHSSCSQSVSRDVLVYHTYHRRWYILAVFSFLAILNNIVWNTWGPLANSTATAWGWNDDMTAMLANWGSVSYLISVTVFVWLIYKKGLRWTVVVAAAVQCVGAACRCVTSQPPASTWLMHVGQMLNGLAMPLTLSGPTAVSVTWFPVHQRTTATAISTVSNGLGCALSFIIGPLLVPDLREHGTNVSTNNLKSVNRTNGTELMVVEETRFYIMRLMYIEFGLCAVALLAVLLYFPSHPPSPPSKTASLKRVNFTKGFKDLCRNKQFWGPALCYAVSTGVFDTWFSMMAILLQPIGVDEDEAGWIGFYGILIGNIAGMLVSFLADLYMHKLKVILFCMYAVGFASYLIFSLQCANILPNHTVVLYVSHIVGSVCLEGGIPLFFELLCETTYPVSEAVTTGVITTINSLVSLVFYFILMAPIGVDWLNWALVGSLVLCLPVFLLHRAKYHRFNIDTVQTLVGPADFTDQDS